VNHRAGSERGVTAVVLAYNGVATLPEVIAAIRAQTHPVARTIIVDNGSTDGTGEFLAGEGGADLLPVLLPANSGVGAGHNTGWRLALEDPGCGFIWSIEHDCVPEPDCLERLLELHRSLGRTAGHLRVGGLIPLQAAPHLFDPRPSYIWRQGRFLRLPKLDSYSAPYLDTRFTFNGTLFVASAVRSAGLLRSDLFVAFEDVEYRDRMREAGFVFVRVPAARVRHDLLKAHPAVRAFGRTWYLPGGNSVPRAYYATRNATYLGLLRSRRKALFRSLTIGKLAASLAYTLAAGPDRSRRMRARVQAVIDGLGGRLGPRDDAFFQ
jgi:rhamnopyranosyl-N-acetylglucosaminyl-diphospho-decaprenol beta-1,3/1,4-galactofuranosyltransferase